MKRRRHALERREIARQLCQIALSPLQAPAHDVGNEILLQPHVRVGIVPRDLGLHHPELGEVPARLRLLGAECRAEGVHLAEGHRVGFVVELSALCQIRRGVLEVLHWKQRRGALAGGRGEDRRVAEDEAAPVDKIGEKPAGLFNTVPTEDRVHHCLHQTDLLCYLYQTEMYHCLHQRAQCQ